MLGCDVEKREPAVANSLQLEWWIGDRTFHSGWSAWYLLVSCGYQRFGSRISISPKGWGQTAKQALRSLKLASASASAHVF